MGTTDLDLPGVGVRPRKGLQHKTIASAVAGEMRNRILSGRLAAGAQLRQDALAEEFDVSRIPVREALMQLEAEGLVIIQPHRGAVVSELSLDEIREVFELRAQLEPRLLRASAPHLSEADFDLLRAIGPRYAALQAAGDMAGCAELNTAFHLGLYRHARKPRTLKIVSQLLQDSDRHTRLQLSYDFRLDRSGEDHARIIALCVEKKFGEACLTMRRHILKAAETLQDSIASLRKG
ncbi:MULTISPECIES: GntR family transcriptional regulator [Kaistia]|uniref:GntR family transcriptional regulator n=1 Tax=Kaistia nematophila TaxID=2994654 RepID=A0A9X3IKT6_9HYPH|nr:GntR family transcriptional regulator [Kaistia nematophila]MBN9025090.1 GntR family transcriptional regulator [Hyphomicrobiales bacterium]MCX5569959.1 GntR family transcriptional regulator [Kaistia nematophila]